MGPVALTSFLFTSLSIMGGVNLREYEEPGPYDRIGASLTETAKEMLQGSFDVSVEKSDVLKTVEDDEGSSGNTCTWVLYRTKFSGKEVGGLSQNDMKQIISDCWEESIQDGTLLSELRQIESDIIKVCTGREELEVEVVEELEGNRGENPLPTFSTSINAISTTSCGGDDTESNKVDETLDDARLRQWQIRIALAQFCSMVVTIFAVMVGRLVVLWNIAPHYTPAINSASGRLVYVNLAAYFADRPSDYELEELGCRELISPVTFEEVPVDYYRFVAINLHPEMALSVYAAFSIILGLPIFLALQSVVGWLEIKFERRMNEVKKKGSKNSGALRNKICRLLFTAVVGFFASYLFFELIKSQQSVVLMPLTQVTPTPYCLVVDSPSGLPPETLIRLYVYSICAIPIGVPAALIGGFIVYTSNKESDDSEASLMKCFCELFGWGALVSGVGLILIWLFVGCGVGVWVNFDSKFISFTQTTTILAEAFAPALFFLKELFGEVVLWC